MKCMIDGYQIVDELMKFINVRNSPPIDMLLTTNHC